MQIHNFISELGRKLNVPELELDDEGCCRLVFDGSTSINFEYDEVEKRLFLSSPLRPLPIQNKGEFYEDLLRSNLFGRKTSGASFAVNAVEGSIVLFHSCQVEQIDFMAFCDFLDGFVTSVEYWKDKLYNESMVTEAKGNDFHIPDQYIIRG